jgi:hypothetical protein
MKLHIFAWLFLCLALLANAAPDNSIYLYLECESGQACINLPDSDGDTMSVMATPALVLGKADFKSARIDTYEDTQQAIMLELQKEAAEKFGKITGENIGRRLAVVFNNKILTAPVVRDAIRGGKIRLDGKQVTFWKEIPWLQELIEESYDASNRSVITYVIVASIVVVSAFSFILLPRMKRTGH